MAQQPGMDYNMMAQQQHMMAQQQQQQQQHMMAQQQEHMMAQHQGIDYNIMAQQQNMMSQPMMNNMMVPQDMQMYNKSQDMNMIQGIHGMQIDPMSGMGNPNFKSLQEMPMSNEMNNQLTNLTNMNNPEIQKNLIHNPASVAPQMNGVMQQMMNNQMGGSKVEQTG